MSFYRNMDAESAAVKYCDEMDSADSDYSRSEYRDIDRRIEQVKADLYEFGRSVIDGDVHTIESIIDDYDEEFISVWIHEYFIFHFVTPEGQSEMYKTMRDAFINKAIAALDHDLAANNGQKYFADIVRK